MLRTIIWFLYFGVSLLFMVPKMLYLRALEKRNETQEIDRIAHKTAKRWASTLLKLSGSQLKVIGAENIPSDEPVLFISNHQGNFDIPILMTLITQPVGFVSKIENAKIPFVNTWMRYLSCVFMDRNDFRQSIKAINEGAKKLSSGYSMIIFPEGTRSKDGKLLDFKPGSVKLASKSKKSIVPVTLNGSIDIMNKSSLIIKPSVVEITFSEPIPYEVVSNHTTEEITEIIKNTIQYNLDGNNKTQKGA